MIQFFILCLLFHFGQSKNNPPVIVEQPQDVIAELDKPMAIHCRAEAASLDDLQIDWYKDGQLVTTDPNARIITEFMALHVINTMPQDAGVYYCIAKNSFGQTQSRKARIQFLKLDKDFLISPVSISASVGERVRLSCQPPHGSPMPIVYWTKDGRNLSSPLDHYDLVFPSIKSSDFGSYHCIASNGLTRQSSVAYLTEFHRPKFTIQPSSSRVDLRHGQSIHLKCQIDDDQYQIEWRFRNRIIGNDTVDISAMEFNQSGIYTCVGHFQKYSFHEDVLLAVYDQKIVNNKETIFSQLNLIVFTGRSAIIECPLPWKSDHQISWTIINQTDINKIKYDFLDKHQYRLKIHPIQEFYNDIIFKCYYQNNDQPSEGLIPLNVQKIQPPPIVSYVPNNQTVAIGAEVRFSCQTNDATNVQWWFVPYNRPHRTIKIDNNRKYRIESDHQLIIRHPEKYDAGMYKCVSTNNNHDQTTWIGHLHVEDARSNAFFHRVELKDLPQAPSQPSVTAINSNSIELVWTSQSTDILDYLIEYCDLNPDNKILEWENLSTKTSTTRQIINHLKSNSTYQFIIRARNSFGYGPPSNVSKIIETKMNQQSNDELIYLYDPVNIQETSITIKWDILQNDPEVNRFFIYITSKKEYNERIETITNSEKTYTINNLRPYTDYVIRLVPSQGTMGRSSNTISVRTLESIPLSSPTDIFIQLMSMTSLSIRWNPPLENETNGEILAYKVNCLASNETNSIRLTNISSDAKGLFIKSLVENMEYCTSIAARTRIGYGPYSQPICVTMNSRFLHINGNSLKYRLQEFITQPWFLLGVILSSTLFTCAFLYGIWLCYHYVNQQHRHRMKFNSSESSSNQSVELPVQKTLSNGKRYDLIKDTPPPSSSTAVWMDSLPNGIRLQCCTTASASSNSDHYSMNIHKNPINALLHECRQQQQQLNPYATTGIFQQATPIYAETVHSPLSSHHLLSDHQPIPLSSPSVQYQPPWLDHHSSSTLQYRSQPRTLYNHHQCIHCTSQSHLHTPSSRHKTMPSPSLHHQNNNPIVKIGVPNMHGIEKSDIDNMPQTMNSLSSIQHPSSNRTMLNSLGGETMITSWTSSIDGNNPESISSSSTDRHEHGKSIDQPKHFSSEGSIFSDSDIQQQQQQNIPNTATSLSLERRPTFLIPNI